jgi:hypothetical protein
MRLFYNQYLQNIEFTFNYLSLITVLVFIVGYEMAVDVSNFCISYFVVRVLLKIMMNFAKPWLCPVTNIYKYIKQ